MNKQFNRTAVLLLLMCFVFVNLTEGQEFLKSNENNSQSNEAKLVLNSIENGIARGDVNKIIGFFGTQTYLSLTNGINGYYSSNQAYYVLEDFFSDYQASSFRFEDIQADKANMYGTGTYTFTVRGKRAEAQVYISLKQNGKKWKITQLTIN